MLNVLERSSTGDFPCGPVGLRLHASSAGGTGSISGWGTKVLHAMGCGPKEKKKKERKVKYNEAERGH